MMIQMKFDFNRTAGLRDIHIGKRECMDGHTDAQTPARVLSPGAFGPGELKSQQTTIKA